MRGHEIPVDMKKRQISVNFEGDSPFCIVYCNGKAKITPLPDHGETRVITHQGKVKRVKYDEGEEF
ncbi:hypothetical protein CEY16_05510 [Halalkalibacillus sediminis]|uniref:DUF3954 domain-containing protein n=2 Tax=Halalkalibacillus sediminis TaxID=2018042 RepID=A0A2I0QXZ4_9BACI|nr:hypothetical protein CEY16_05510 [Halalkalibacillus sediminis]